MRSLRAMAARLADSHEFATRKSGNVENRPRPAAKAWTRAVRAIISAAMKKKAYARAGVDIDLGNRVKATLPQLLRATHRPEVLGKVGGFGGLFAFNARKFKEPVLVSSVDGVGTKLKLAFAMDRHDTIGQDLVNHCVNDIAVLGAEPGNNYLDALLCLAYLRTSLLQKTTPQEVGARKVPMPIGIGGALRIPGPIEGQTILYPRPEVLRE